MEDDDRSPDSPPAGLPQSRGALFLSDGGLETTLVFERGIQLPHFAAFPLLADERGRQLLVEYYKPYLTLAARTPGAGFSWVFPSSSWSLAPYPRDTKQSANKASLTSKYDQPARRHDLTFK